MVLKTVVIIGLLKILGDPDGETKVMSKLKEIPVITKELDIVVSQSILVILQLLKLEKKKILFLMKLKKNSKHGKKNTEKIT